MSQKIRIKLKSFDHMLIDKSAKKIVETVSSTGARVIIETGAISARWYALGGPAVLGFPVTDEIRWVDGVTRVTFSSGTTINWTQARGTWVS